MKLLKLLILKLEVKLQLLLVALKIKVLKLLNRDDTTGDK